MSIPTRRRAELSPNQLRVALFSGNYNYVKDGANQALNRLVGYLERLGAHVLVFSPTTKTPAFEPTGKLVGVPSLPIPGRNEYRVAFGVNPMSRLTLAHFAPNIIHVSAPDFLCHGALRLAEKWSIPSIATVHTRFESYPAYYGFGWIEQPLVQFLRRFYRRCDKVFAPSPSMAAELESLGMADHIGLWTRGIDLELFHPGRRDWGWRRSLGIKDSEVVVGFVSRLVLEKGIDVFADTVAELRQRGIRHRVLVVGEGPAEQHFRRRVPDAIFTGFLQRESLARAYASSDLFLFPSVTETFGNVTLEAMASGLPTICADATGSDALVDPDVSGFLIEPTSISGYADAVETLTRDTELRRRMAAQARTRSELYDWDRVMAGLVNEYIDAIANPKHNG